MMMARLTMTALLASLAGCGGAESAGPVPVVQGTNGPAAPDSLAGSGMGVGGANGGMGNGGGVQAGGGPAVN